MTKEDADFLKEMTWAARGAVWQFIIDHSSVMGNGSYRVVFYTTGEENFWQRVVARHTGAFSRYSKQERLASSRHRRQSVKRESWHLRDATLSFVGNRGSLAQRALSYALRFCERHLYGTPAARARLARRGAKFAGADDETK